MSSILDALKKVQSRQQEIDLNEEPDIETAEKLVVDEDKPARSITFDLTPKLIALCAVCVVALAALSGGLVYILGAQRESPVRQVPVRAPVVAAPEQTSPTSDVASRSIPTTAPAEVEQTTVSPVAVVEPAAPSVPQDAAQHEEATTQVAAQPEPPAPLREVVAPPAVPVALTEPEPASPPPDTGIQERPLGPAAEPPAAVQPPTETVATAQVDQPPPGLPKLTINMLKSATPANPVSSAVVNLTPVRVGDVVEGARVVEIRDMEKVVVFEYQGYQFNVKF
jgi:hypothetical protein